MLSFLILDNVYTSNSDKCILPVVNVLTEWRHDFSFFTSLSLSLQYLDRLMKVCDDCSY